MTTFIIRHHGREEEVTPLRTTKPDRFAYRGEDGQAHVLPVEQIVNLRVKENP